MRTAQHAEIWVATPQSEYTGLRGDWKAYFKRVGFTTTCRVEDNFGTQLVNVIGKPTGQPLPGFMQSTVSMELATIKGDDFRNLGAMNPLWAFLPIYQKERLIEVPLQVTQEHGTSADDKMLPFTFVLAIKNKISNSFTETHLKQDPTFAPGMGNSYAPALDGSPKRSNLLGLYACVLSNASVSLSSQNAVIMESITAQAQPLSGAWLNEEIKRKLRGTDSIDATEQNNGTFDILSLVYGYDIPGTSGREV